MCLPILKVITRCLHCPSGTALRGHASPSQPHGYTVTMLHHESPLYVYASACPLCTLALPSSVVVARSTFANGFVALLLHELHRVPCFPTLRSFFFSLKTSNLENLVKIVKFRSMISPWTNSYMIKKYHPSELHRVP